LVRLSLVSFSLQVDELIDAFFDEDMMAASYSLLKAKVAEKFPKAVEADVGV
jgi:hypothetical protein